MACMAQPCLERRTESANPIPITPDTRPSSENVSLAEPKWYTNAYLLGRVFERVGLLGTIQEHRRNFAGLSSSMGLVERERACTSRILSTRRFHDISLQKPYRLSCMLSRKSISDQHAYRCLDYTCMHIGIDKLTPQYDARVHIVSHMFFAGAIKLANTSPNTSFLGTTCVQEPSADPAKPLNCHLFSLRR